ncbi:MAG: guanylate kinase [Lachnospiraceae bacterium]|nr:guanylate kinase [Lachnospiraceae bacterium]
MAKKGLLIVLSGFSGAGKGTLIRKLMEAHDHYVLSVSMTTRSPREGEQEGREYFFTDEAHFTEMIDRNGFLEHAVYSGNHYGTPRAFVEEQLTAGKDVLLEIEVQGALQVKERFPEALLIYVVTPTVAELRRRLEGRGTESAEAIARRLKRAADESDTLASYEYIVINDDVTRCAEEIHGIVQGARCATARNADFMEEMRKALHAAFDH